MPNWMTSLGPALAVVLGAAIALCGTLVAPWITARIGRDQWHRQTRMDAYAGLAKSVHYLSEALRIPQHVEEPGLKPAEQGIEQGLYQVTMAVAMVQLVGASAVSATTRDLDGWLTKTAAFVKSYDGKHADQLDRMAAELDFLCTDFMAEARKDLGMSSARRGG